MYQGIELIKQELSEILASITAALILIIQLLCKYYALRIIVCINLASLVHFRHSRLLSNSWSANKMFLTLQHTNKHIRILDFDNTVAI